MRIENPETIHHAGLMTEAVVPAETLRGWLMLGWEAGPFPVTVDAPPPRNGLGSGIEPWRIYAMDRGLVVPDDLTRDQVIALVDELDLSLAGDTPVDDDPAPQGQNPDPQEGAS